MSYGHRAVLPPIIPRLHPYTRSARSPCFVSGYHYHHSRTLPSPIILSHTHTRRRCRCLRSPSSLSPYGNCCVLCSVLLEDSFRCCSYGCGCKLLDMHALGICSDPMASYAEIVEWELELYEVCTPYRRWQLLWQEAKNVPTRGIEPRAIA